ncbi:MAG: lipopolysaccharide heptosyltransferase II [Bacteroidetes bacterium]|nr:lipopolysaccharide heptosyltransferase II [Bacteroidota bacterium]
MKPVTNILVRLPNWLGDMVMSTAFIKALQQQYPDAAIDVIAKKGIDFLLDYFPAHRNHFIFDKQVHKGLRGAYRFGKTLRDNHYDLFFCLPDSFSSAVMAWGTGAKQRIGYKKELRSFFLSKSYRKKKDLHRVDEYVDLLQQFTNALYQHTQVSLLHPAAVKKNAVVININSEADSRRLPVEKAVTIIEAVQKNIAQEIILIGSNKEKDHVDAVFNGLSNIHNISNLAGKTSLRELTDVLASAQLMLTTDSGPAHVANASGTPVVVLFGAGNENNTAPYNAVNRTIIRLGQLPCEPCVSNTCKVFGTPQCLLQLDEQKIVDAVTALLHQSS